MAVNQFTQTRPEFIHLSPLTSGMDFIDLAEYNERLVSVLMETDISAERFAIYEKIAGSLEHLQLAFDEPVPDYRLPQLTAAEVTDFHNTAFVAEPEIITRYCRALTQILRNRAADSDTQEVLTELLFDLVSFLVEDLKAPRYIETYSGLVQVR
ncbi:hypothetical protein [Pantoea sp. BAV 3049]|uniref:hypothetical protein n=1 Tax=Pantoea sp. BAV 3049 TaxID=2654188 RepID=UPI00131D6416|nr:hypothetical protein [Pantoea sp. BAV 3049]